MDSRLEAYLSAFRRNVQLVYELMDFDRLVQDRALQILSDVQAAVTDELKYTARLRLDNGIQSLQNVRQNDSLRRHYEHMLNQCVVLLVSYFGSTARAAFAHTLQLLLDAGGAKRLLTIDLKLTVAELREFRCEDLVDMFISKREISFQDMQSIARAFRDFVGLEPTRSEDVNDIIVGHACRHVIVHAAGLFDKRAVAQVKTAVPRRLKNDLSLGDTVRFDEAEIRMLGNAMDAYLSEIAAEASAAVSRAARESETIGDS